MNTTKPTPPNDEGVSAPPLLADHTVAHTEAALHATLTFLAEHREAVLRGRADELQHLCRAIFPCMDNDAHFLACVRALEKQGHVLKPNPRKRALSLAKVLCGPDDSSAEILTYRRAGRRSQEILELAARGVPADDVGAYVRSLANVTMLQESWRERWRNGGAGIMPGTAQGTLPSGTRFEVTIDPDLAYAIEPSAMDGDQPLSAIRETFQDGRVAFTIKQSGDATTATLLPGVKLPEGYTVMHLVVKSDDFDLLDGSPPIAVIRVKIHRDKQKRPFLRSLKVTPERAEDTRADERVNQTRMAPVQGTAGPRMATTEAPRPVGSPPPAAPSPGMGRSNSMPRPPYPHAPRPAPGRSPKPPPAPVQRSHQRRTPTSEAN